MQSVNEIKKKLRISLETEFPMTSVTAIANSSFSEIDVYIFQQNDVEKGDHVPLSGWSVTTEILLEATKDLFLLDLPKENRDDLATFYICVFIKDSLSGINFVEGDDAIRFASRMPKASIW
jgi:hypothetical protein